MSKKNNVIIGSGLSALMVARMIKKYKNPEAKITIIEREAKIGGQFGSVDYGKHGHFDYGMHIYYESCIPEIDTLFTSLLPENEWNILENNYKDVAGLFVNGKLQTLTPYVDLRNLSETKIKKYIAELFLNIQKQFGKTLPDGANAYQVLEYRFGKTITDEIFVPILEKLYHNHPSNLDEIATQLTTINRIALFNEDVILDLMNSAEIRARVCFPNQYTMPPIRKNKQRGFYPKKYGMFRVLEKFKLELENEGVEFYTSTMVNDLQIENDEIVSISVSDKEGIRKIGNIENVYWTAGLPSLASVLKIEMGQMNYDKQLNTAYYVNILFDKNPMMDKLYYFYCFDKDYRTFRVTNYTNYCPKANENRGFPICLELWAHQGDVTDEKDILDLALKELNSFKIINNSYKVTFAKVDKALGGGFPLPTLNNVGGMNAIREKIKQKNVKNLTSIGVYASKNVFFIKDVLTDAYNKIAYLN